jgi:hypothetical protein
LELAVPGLASCERVSGSAHSVTRTIGWARAVLARYSTTAVGDRKPSRVNIGSTTPKARRHLSLQCNTSRNSRLLLHRMIPESRLAKEKMHLVLGLEWSEEPKCSLQFFSIGGIAVLFWMLTALFSEA